jgi:SAM-dependent methyltransferase
MDRLLLNLGSGPPGASWLPALFSDWRQLRVDVDPRAVPDIVADAVDLSSIASGVADAVWTAHCLEHLYAHDVPLALAEIRRVLKDDGFGCILVPDLQRIAAFVAEDRMHEPIYTSPAGPVCPHDVLFGFGPALARGHLSMAHRCGFTPTGLIGQLNAAGFGGYAVLRRANFELAAVVRRRDWPDAASRDALLQTLGL